MSEYVKVKEMSEVKKEYVVIDVQPHFTGNERCVLLIQKDKPEWQKGYLNLVGGAVEDQESPYEAAIRELREETGYKPFDHHIDPVQWMGTIECEQERIHCYIVYVDVYDQPEPNIEREIVRWYPWRIVKDDKRLIPSLRVVLPMLMAGVYDWKMYVSQSFMQQEFQYCEMKIPSELNDSFFKNELVTNILEGKNVKIIDDALDLPTPLTIDFNKPLTLIDPDIEQDN